METWEKEWDKEARETVKKYKEENKLPTNGVLSPNRPLSRKLEFAVNK